MLEPVADGILRRTSAYVNSLHVRDRASICSLTPDAGDDVRTWWTSEPVVRSAGGPRRDENAAPARPMGMGSFSKACCSVMSGAVNAAAPGDKPEPFVFR